MAYTLTQARPLLNAAELELFEQSRAEPVKQLTGAKLAGAVKRTRTLRDKYRDLYQRQTVAVRTSTPGAVTGADNERTQRKADILQEVLERYETRAAALQVQGSSPAAAQTGRKAAPKAGGARSKAASAQAAESPTGAQKKQTAAGRGAAAAPAPSSSAQTPAGAADKNPAKAKAQSKAQSKAKTQTKTEAAPASKAARTDKAARPAAAATGSKAGTGTGTGTSTGTKKSAVSAQLNTLAGAGAKAAAGTAAPQAPARSARTAGSPPVRSSKAPSRKAPTAGNKAEAPQVNAPLDTVPAAKRGTSPLKQDPTNIAIQAHQSSHGRRTQGKRDSR